MMLESTRNHWSSVITNIFKNIVSNIIFIVLLTKWLSDYIILIAILIISIDIIVAFISWRNNTFYIKDNILFIENGVFEKSKKEIPLEKISTVDTKASILNTILGVSLLSINTGAVGVINSAEFKFLLKNEKIEDLKRILLSENKENEVLEVEDTQQEENISYKEQYTYKVSFKDILKYTFTKSKIYFILPIGVIIDKLNSTIGLDELNKYIEKHSGDIENIGSKVSEFPILTMVLMIAGLLITIYIIATIICFVLDYIKYYDFTLYREDNNISIQYGLLNKNKFNFKLEQVNSLKLKQNLLCQMFGLYNIEVGVIGYGNSDDSKIKSILYPIANKKLKDDIIKNILNEFEFKEDLYKPYKKYSYMFLTKRYIITMAIILLVSYFDNFTNFEFDIYKIIFLVILGVQTFLGYMSYNNNAIGIDDKNIFLSNGSILKKIIIIPKDKVQSIAYKQGIFQKNKSICDYSIDIYSDDLGDIIKVKNIEKNLVFTLENKIV